MGLMILTSGLTFLLILVQFKKCAKGTYRFVLCAGSAGALIGVIGFVVGIGGLAFGMHGGPINTILTALMGLALAVVGYLLARKGLDSLKLMKGRITPAPKVP